MKFNVFATIPHFVSHAHRRIFCRQCKKWQQAHIEKMEAFRLRKAALFVIRRERWRLKRWSGAILASKSPKSIPRTTRIYKGNNALKVNQFVDCKDYRCESISERLNRLKEKSLVHTSLFEWNTLGRIQQIKIKIKEK